MPNYKLLLADDSVTIQKVVNLTFADEGIEVVAVGDGDSAIAKLAEFTPDLVMADVNMPGRSGYQVCEAIRQNPALERVPVLLLVGSFEPFDEDEARRVGANDYMTKPFQSIRQLVSKVTDLLAGESAQAHEAASTEAVDGAVGSTAAVGFDSTSETVEMEPPAEPPFGFGDVGSDDEMIESNRLAEPDAAREAFDDGIVTQPLDEAELKEFALVGDDSYAPEPEPEHFVPESAYYAESPESVEDFEREAVADASAFEATIREPLFGAASPVSIDEGNLLDLPPLVDETGIRPAFRTPEPEPVAPVVEPSAPVVDEDLIARITYQVADRIADRLARALDNESLRQVVSEVVAGFDRKDEPS